MICNEVESLITEYLEDEMPESVRADFEAHLEVCRECQNRLAETRALIDASHNLGEKIRQDWRERTGGETAEQYFKDWKASCWANHALPDGPTADWLLPLPLSQSLQLRSGSGSMFKMCGSPECL